MEQQLFFCKRKTNKGWHSRRWLPSLCGTLLQKIFGLVALAAAKYLALLFLFFKMISFFIVAGL
jgi:hypothetical protein